MHVLKNPNDLSSLEYTSIVTQSNVFSVAHHEKENQNLFIRFTHASETATLDFTGAGDYSVYFYDQNGQFVSKQYAFLNVEKSILETQHKAMLLLKHSTKKENWHEQQLPNPAYGLFPYIIVKIGYAIFKQIPINFRKNGEVVGIHNCPDKQVDDVPENPLSLSRENLSRLHEDRILEEAAFIIERTAAHLELEPKGCVVFGKNRALYYGNGKFTESTSIPSGGILLGQENIIGMHVSHYSENQ